jgi:hypothetical protein
VGRQIEPGQGICRVVVFITRINIDCSTPTVHLWRGRWRCVKRKGSQSTRWPDWANGVIVYPVSCFENYRSNPYFRFIFSVEKMYVLLLTKNGLGYILGDFFTNSFGHPASQSCLFAPHICLLLLQLTRLSLEAFW